VQKDPYQNWSLRAAVDRDAQWIAELRAVVLRPDLERLGRFDPVRVRQRFLSTFDAVVTQVVLVGGQEAGSIAVRPDEGSLWIEHFYLRADCQGMGIGSLVLRRQLGASQADRPFRLNVLRGSRAQALYERHGFVVESQDAVDVFMVRYRAERRQEPGGQSSCGRLPEKANKPCLTWQNTTDTTLRIYSSIQHHIGRKINPVGVVPT
jgi:GNAT superfamily N-acetyltransferase